MLFSNGPVISFVIILYFDKLITIALHLSTLEDFHMGYGNGLCMFNEHISKFTERRGKIQFSPLKTFI